MKRRGRTMRPPFSSARPAAQRSPIRGRRRSWRMVPMITRVWRGWASAADADAYQEHFSGEVLAHLGQIDGFVSAQLWRNEDPDEVEFVAVTTFESLAAIRAFAGADPERSVVEPAARRVLRRFDERCRHY